MSLSLERKASIIDPFWIVVCSIGGYLVIAAICLGVAAKIESVMRIPGPLDSRIPGKFPTLPLILMSLAWFPLVVVLVIACISSVPRAIAGLTHRSVAPIPSAPPPQ